MEYNNECNNNNKYKRSIMKVQCTKEWKEKGKKEGEKGNIVRKATSLRRNGCSLYNKLKGNIFTVVNWML